MNIEYSDRIYREEAGVRALSTVLKTLEVLEYFSTLRKSVRMHEVADALALSRPTAYQRLLTLVEAGWLEQDEVGRYRLSLHSSRIAAAALEQASFGERAVPMLAKLVAQVSETASLAVLDRGLPCIVQRVESDAVLRAEQKIGTTLSLSETASGRILSAFADASTLEKLSRGGEPLPDAELIAAIRIDGYAVSSGSSMPGIRAIGAPIFDSIGKCVAALTLVGPAARFDADALRAPLLATAREINEMMQGVGR